jgi:hypothetical protein
MPGNRAAPSFGAGAAPATGAGDVDGRNKSGHDEGKYRWDLVAGWTAGDAEVGTALGTLAHPMLAGGEAHDSQ